MESLFLPRTNSNRTMNLIMYFKCIGLAPCLPHLCWVLYRHNRQIRKKKGPMGIGFDFSFLSTASTSTTHLLGSQSATQSWPWPGSRKCPLEGGKASMMSKLHSTCQNLVSIGQKSPSTLWYARMDQFRTWEMDKRRLLGHRAVDRHPLPNHQRWRRI